MLNERWLWNFAYTSCEHLKLRSPEKYCQESSTRLTVYLQRNLNGPSSDHSSGSNDDESSRAVNSFCLLFDFINRVTGEVAFTVGDQSTVHYLPHGDSGDDMRMLALEVTIANEVLIKHNFGFMALPYDSLDELHVLITAMELEDKSLYGGHIFHQKLLQDFDSTLLNRLTPQSLMRHIDANEETPRTRCYNSSGEDSGYVRMRYTSLTNRSNLEMNFMVN